MAATHATREAIWLRRALVNLGFSLDGPTTIYCDNQGANALTVNPEFHARTKHIDIQHHYVRERVAAGDVKFEYRHTNDMPADFLTKGVATDKHRKFSSMIGLQLSGGVRGHSEPTTK